MTPLRFPNNYVDGNSLKPYYFSNDEHYYFYLPDKLLQYILDHFPFIQK